jgi:NAD(P)-dependent dehydrogenase (short-subunit alcohol dehydrogenase family)
VTVNSVLPGPTMSDGFAEMMKDEIEKTGKSLEQLAKEFVMANRPSSVIQRAATVEEVANMVIYVCSPRPPPPRARRCASTVAWMTSSDAVRPHCCDATGGNVVCLPVIIRQVETVTP